jgi:hypothetical protein
MKIKTLLLTAIATLGITAASTAQNVPSYVPTDGLLGWWPFNGNANDESGNGNNGSVMEATLTADRFGNANSSYSFDGVNDNISVPHNDILDFDFGFSASLWIWIEQLGPNNQWIIDKCYDPSAYHWGLGMDANGQLSTIFLTSNGTIQTNGNSNHYFDVQQWIFLTMTYDGDIVKIYDGHNMIWSELGTGDMIDNNLPLKFGNFPHDNMPPYGYHFNGKVDDIAIYNRALTPQEISALYTATSSNNNEASNTTANVPGAISYQAVARDTQGAPLADTNVQVQFTLIADSLSGAEEYVETHTLTTNSLGLFTTAFGGGTPVSNSFDSINWSAGNKFLNVQIDTGNGLVDIGTQQLLSTPYSLHSATAGAIKNPGLPIYSDNAAALAGGLSSGDMYRTGAGVLMVVY